MSIRASAERFWAGGGPHLRFENCRSDPVIFCMNEGCITSRDLNAAHQQTEAQKVMNQIANECKLWIKINASAQSSKNVGLVHDTVIHYNWLNFGVNSLRKQCVSRLLLLFRDRISSKKIISVKKATTKICMSTILRVCLLNYESRLENNLFLVRMNGSKVTFCFSSITWVKINLNFGWHENLSWFS